MATRQECREHGTEILSKEGRMSANRLHPGLLEAAARELDRNLRA